jgi:hypothetical protein
VPAGLRCAMNAHFDAIDCDDGKAWRLAHEASAILYAARRHAATGSAVEVVRTDADGARQVVVLPPLAAHASP